MDSRVLLLGVGFKTKIGVHYGISDSLREKTRIAHGSDGLPAPGSGGRLYEDRG